MQNGVMATYKFHRLEFWVRLLILHPLLNRKGTYKMSKSFIGVPMVMLKSYYKKLREEARIARQKAWAKKKKNTTSEEE